MLLDAMCVISYAWINSNCICLPETLKWEPKSLIFHVIHLTMFFRDVSMTLRHSYTSIIILPHTMDLLWEKFQWILSLYMKPISFQSKPSVVCPVTAVIFIDYCLKKLNVFSQHIGKKTNEYLNSAEQITRNWNVDQLSVLNTCWDII